MISDEEVTADLRPLLEAGRARIIARDSYRLNGGEMVSLTIVVGTDRLPECTGITADWCDVCGACKCPEGTDRGTSYSGCPLHGPHSRHAEGR